MSMPAIPADYSALVFADQGLSLDLSRGRPKPRKPKVKVDKPRELSQAELRYAQVEHVIVSMREKCGRPATFIRPEEVPA
jgi:hypothetical protein